MAGVADLHRPQHAVQVKLPAHRAGASGRCKDDYRVGFLPAYPAKAGWGVSRLARETLVNWAENFLHALDRSVPRTVRGGFHKMGDMEMLMEQGQRAPHYRPPNQTYGRKVRCGSQGRGDCLSCFLAHCAGK